jgi:hypothetical protein
MQPQILVLPCAAHSSPFLDNAILQDATVQIRSDQPDDTGIANTLL